MQEWSPPRSQVNGWWPPGSYLNDLQVIRKTCPTVHLLPLNSLMRPFVVIIILTFPVSPGLYSSSLCLHTQTFGPRSSSRRHGWRISRALGWSGFTVKSISSCLNLRLFADNLFPVRLFVLRPRPSPSHKQVKSNKAPATTKRQSPLISHRSTQTASSVLTEDSHMWWNMSI